MADYLRKVFRFIFGEPKSSPPTSQPEITAVQAKDMIEEQVQATNKTSSLAVEVIRYSKGAKDILGKLYINGSFKCFTLEYIHPEKGENGSIIPMGLYELGLRNEGGKNAAYYFRYKAMHRGMIWIQNAQSFPFAVLHEGNQYTDVPGSLLVGELPIREDEINRPREVWYSDQAYRNIYPLLADAITQGIPAKLWIKES